MDGAVDSASADSTAPLPSEQIAQPRGKRRTMWIAIATGVAAFIAGAVFGSIGSSQNLNDAEAKLKTAEKRAAIARLQRDAANAKVADRTKQMKADALAVAAQEARDKERAQKEGDAAAAAAAKAAADQAAAAKAASDAAAAKASVDAAAAAERTQINGDGTYLIGTDKAAGRYRTVGPVTNCYWQISSDPNGENILQNNISSGVSYVQVSNGQYLEVNRCGVWQKVG